MVVEFISEDEVLAKRWQIYSVPITPDYTDDDFESEYNQSIERLEKALRAAGWKRGYKENDDFDILEDCYAPHRSLGLTVQSERIIVPRFISILTEFLRSERNPWMINISDDRGNFRLVAEVGKLTIIAVDDKILSSLGIKK